MAWNLKQSSEDDEREETQDEFLERYAKAAATLEDGMITEEGDVEDQVQELELGKAILNSFVTFTAQIEKILLPLVAMDESAVAFSISLITNLLCVTSKLQYRSANNLNKNDLNLNYDYFRYIPTQPTPSPGLECPDLQLFREVPSLLSIQ